MLARVLPAEAKLRKSPEDLAARLDLVGAYAETADHAGAALALYPLLQQGDAKLRERFITHALAISWMDEAVQAYQSIEQPRPELTLQLAAAYAHRGDAPNAADLLQSLKNQSLPPETWLEGAALWLQLRQPALARQWAERGAVQSKDSSATLLVARCLYAEGRPEEVVARLRAAGLEGKDGIAEFWISRSLLRSADGSARAQGLERMQRLAAENPGNAVAAFEAGRALLQSGHPRAATGFLTRAMQADYQTTLCYELLAKAYRQLGMRREALWAEGRSLSLVGKVREAQDLFRESLELDPSKPAAYLDLAKAYSADLQPQKALQVLDRARKIAPENVEVAMLRAAVLGRLERVTEQIDALEDTATLDPQRANEPLGELGKLYYGSQQYDLAISTLERTVELEAGDALAHFYLGLCYAKKASEGQGEDAVRHLLRTTKVQPDYHYPWINAGSTLLRMGHSAEAAACFRRAIDGDSRWDGPYLSLAQVLQREQRQEERKLALRQYARARELEAERGRLEDRATRTPQDAAVRFALGERLLRDGRHHEAFTEFQHATAFRPRWQKAQSRLADVCALLEFDDLQRNAERAAE